MRNGSEGTGRKFGKSHFCELDEGCEIGDKGELEQGNGGGCFKGPERVEVSMDERGAGRSSIGVTREEV